MAGRVTGKKALVTGAAQGLGAAIAAELAREGARVALADINLPGAEARAAEINAECGEGAAFALALDVTDEAQWRTARADAAARLDGLSVLVNNAGLGDYGDIESFAFAQWKRVMSVNVDSVFLGVKYALAYMRQSQPGSIINMSSIAGLIASEAYPAYNASKAAVWLLSKSIALHCAAQKLDIRCNSVHPTFIDTPILDPLRAMLGADSADAKLARQIPLGRLGAPADVAKAVLYLASDDSRFVTGAELKVDGGISAR